jgi:hypothetical protein
VIGVLLLVVAFVGCWGALKENRKLLIAFFCMVLFFVIVQFGVGIAAYVMRDDLPAYADQTWNFFWINDRSVIDTAENQFKCCGFKEVSDRAVPPTGKEATCANSWYQDRGSCSTAINDEIQLLFNNGGEEAALTRTASIQTSQNCCGWTAITDPAPWGAMENGTIPCISTLPCFNQLNASWVASWNSRSAAGDNFIISYERGVRLLLLRLVSVC